MYTDRDIANIQESYQCSYCGSIDGFNCVCDEPENCYKCGDEIEVSGICEFCELNLRENF